MEILSLEDAIINCPGDCYGHLHYVDTISYPGPNDYTTNYFLVFQCDTCNEKYEIRT